MESENTTNVDILKFLSLEAQRWRKIGSFYTEDSSVLLKMLEGGIYADIILIAQGGSVKAHRSVLASMSPVFDAMFQHNMKEQLTSTVDIPDMTIDGLQLFLLVLYTPTSDKFRCGWDSYTLSEVVSSAIDKHFAEFWGAVHKYQVVTRLKDVLLFALQRNLTLDNCWDYFNELLQGSHASSVNCKYILENSNNIIESERFLKEMKCNPQHFAEFWGATHNQVVTRLEDMLLCTLQKNLTLDNCWDYFNDLPQGSHAFDVNCKYILENCNNVIESERFLKEMKCNPQQVQSILKIIMKHQEI